MCWCWDTCCFLYEVHVKPGKATIGRPEAEATKALKSEICWRSSALNGGSTICLHLSSVSISLEIHVAGIGLFDKMMIQGLGINKLEPLYLVDWILPSHAFSTLIKNSLVLKDALVNVDLCIVKITILGFGSGAALYNFMRRLEISFDVPPTSTTSAFPLCSNILAHSDFPQKTKLN